MGDFIGLADAGGGDARSFIGVAVALGFALFMLRLWKTGGTDPGAASLADLVKALDESASFSSKQLEQFGANNEQFKAVVAGVGRMEARLERIHDALQEIERNTRP